MQYSAYTQITRNDQIWPLTQSLTQPAYAFRIGFLGDQIDRFDDTLLGKVLEQKSFNRHRPEGDDDFGGTLDAKWLLSTPLTDLYAVDRHRIVAANFSEIDHWDSKWQLRQAIQWLRAKEVQLIFFQYKWMLSSAMQSVLHFPEDQCFSTVASA